jgi:pyruvate dehydrogenase E2 component (dihydrolipoamide acetyltransferase)
MSYIVRMPKLGLEMKEGTLLAWHVDEGEAVEAGDLLAEVESEKAQAEVEAREDGVMRLIALPEGETCEPGDPVGIVAGAEEDVADLEAEFEGGGEPEAEADTEVPAGAEPEGTPSPDGTDASGGAVKATPPARKRAADLGLDLATVEGSGPGGAVTPEDVERAAGEGHEEDGTGAAGPTVREERPLSGTRRTIAGRLGESYRNAVHVTELMTADAEKLRAAADAADATLDADVSVVDVLLVALSESLSEHPEFNAQYEDDVHRLYEEHNVCVAVDTDQGLLAPVVRDVGERSLASVADERRAVTDRVLAGEHSMADLSGGTITVTNLGPFGVESFDPVINPPQVAILGVNAVAERAVPAADGTVEVRRRLPLTLSFDHRVVDGADAARFLRTLVEHVESPWSLVPAEVRSEREA